MVPQQAEKEEPVSHVPHELSEEFPKDCDTIRALKEADRHFARLTEEYHHVNRAIHRAETEAETVSDDALETMKKERLRLADAIAAYVRDARNGVRESI